MEITFDQLPKAVSQLCEDMAFLKRYILEKNNDLPSSADQWFDINELRDYLPDKPAKPTLYSYVSANSIPYHKGPKKLRFLKSEIDAWLKQGKNKTPSETESQTDAFLSHHRAKKITQNRPSKLNLKN